MRTIKFFTLGCKVNQYDTQVIREQFLNAGFKELDDHLYADVYVINTCTVTANADSRSFNLIRRAKRENPRAKIIVTGCLAELDGERISGISGITHIVKNEEKDRIIELLNELNEHNGPNGHNDKGISNFSGHTRAFLKIQDGCNNFCSYCKVPLVRGASRSKPLDEIIQEANRLVKNGFQELVLCGICLGSYGKDLQSQKNVVDVIEALEKINGLLRIRLSSIEASDVSERLIEKMAQSKKLCRHLHIPVQSGDDEILKRMNRNYCREDYLNLVKKIKMSIPQIAITTDVLVGFPGETEENFQNTVKLVQEILPLKMHIFPYSLREGTPAANFKPILNPKIIKEGIKYLKNIAERCSLEYKNQFLNKNMNALIEGRSKENPCFWEGYTDNYIRVWVKSDLNLKNQLISLKLKKIVIAKGFILADFC
ncbi:MAG: tRNA (N(6)-L-threonylcarbamoyladenosine(37)-C(2))-methylthiotransferase MtaB [Candidatus Omnitrophica bacterium CG23_combo_of_CG06-09_8_20_14_all_40_11]|nr:MAG: tRNA (N(6)-L-threonylcarbamoyladenosine(37)-C(2))-methylthiotransferase MtaB [Candidatus Omnitrophica bacterium CG23_combo_of_CG06-09_8_20_14_all_40_11]